MKTGGQVLVDALHRHGVSTVFGIPGTHNLALFGALPAAGIRTVLTRHEQGAGYAADGYARVSGRPGVCITTSGPAILNATAAAAQAWSDSVPVLFLAPGPPTDHPALGNGLLHELRDQRAALAGVVAHAHRVTSVAEIPRAVAAAFAAMLGGRPRPAYLEIPLDLLDAAGPADPVAPLPLPRLVPEPAALDAATEVLAGARRPVIIAGGGSRGAARSLLAIAERLGAPVLTSTNGKGTVPESHPLSVGAGLHQPAAHALVSEADVVLAVGTELAPSDLWNGPFDLPGTLVRIDVDVLALGANADPDIRLLGHAAPTLDALLARLPDTNPRLTVHETPTHRAQNPDTPSTKPRHTGREGLRGDAVREGAAYRGILEGLAEVVDEATIVAGDSTMACYYGALSGLPVHRPGGFLYPTGGGTLGYGLPAAIGAALAAPDARVLAILGDGGVMFTVAELATAAQLHLPLPVLVVDNGGYGEIRNEMEDRGDEPIAVDLDPVDFPTLARALNCHGEDIRDPTTLPDALAKAWRTDRPTLLHIRLPPR